MLLGEILEKSAWVYPDKEAFVQEGLRLTYRNLNERVNRLANSLIAIGLKKGDRIAILSKNSVQYMELYFAIGKLGAVSVPINWRLKEEELAHVVKDSTPRALFMSSEYAGLVDGLRGEFKTVDHHFLIGGEAGWARSFQSLIETGSSERPDVQPNVDDLAILFYTSGTTAKPKGVLWSHRTLHYHCLNINLAWRFTPDMVNLVVLPLFHQTGAHTIGVTYAGGTSVILPEFKTERILRMIPEEKITFILMVPTTIVMLLEHPEIGKWDLSSLRTIQYGGAPMPTRPLEKGLRLLKCEFRQSYGMTELGILTSLSPEDHRMDGSEKKLKRFCSVGRPVPDVIGIKIVDGDDVELPMGKNGEIAAKVPSQMLGYWNLPEETEKALKGGWVHTGDMGYFDEDGYLYLTERKKDIIITGGENVSGKEVEEVLYTHPAVLEATVIGVPHDLWGEAVKAVVVLKKGKEATEEELIRYCRERLAGYKTPKSVDFAESLPKSTVGKVLKREVRQKYGPFPGGEPGAGSL